MSVSLPGLLAPSITRAFLLLASLPIERLTFRRVRNAVRWGCR
jgi:hypothetical protein